MSDGTGTPEDCAAAAQLYGGDLACEYSCLGFGDCLRAVTAVAPPEVTRYFEWLTAAWVSVAYAQR